MYRGFIAALSREVPGFGQAFSGYHAPVMRMIAINQGGGDGVCPGARAKRRRLAILAAIRRASHAISVYHSTSQAATGKYGVL